MLWYILLTEQGTANFMQKKRVSKKEFHYTIQPNGDKLLFDTLIQQAIRLIDIVCRLVAVLI